MVIWLHESNIQKGKVMMTFQTQDGNKIENSIVSLVMQFFLKSIASKNLIGLIT